MLTPTAGATTPRIDLLGAYSQFNPNQQGMVARLVLPPLDVPGRNGYFGVVPKKAVLALIEARRAAKANPSRSEWTPDSDNYAIAEFTHEIPVDSQERDQYAPWFNADEMAAFMCAQIVERAIEKNAADAVMNDTTFPASGGTGATVGTAWGTWASATPVTDLLAGYAALRDNFGVEPNTFICPKSSYDNLVNCAEFKDRQKYVGIAAGNQTVEVFRTVLGAAMADAGASQPLKVILPWCRYNSANPASTVSTSAIWPTNRAMLTVTMEGPDFMSPQLGRQFRRAVEPELVSYPEKSKFEVVCATQHVQNKIMSGAPAYMLRGI